MNKIVFCLPLGLANGGVTTWAVTLARRLGAAGLNAEILSHANPNSIGFVAPDDVTIKPVKGVNAWDALPPDVLQFLPQYSSCIDGDTVIVPNFSFGAFAAASLLAICNPRRVKILGICHTDEDHYYDLLAYYEPAIAKFIGVSSEIVKKLAAKLPHRADDISMLVYPVPAAKSAKDMPKAPPDRLVITYAGRFENEQKRIRDAEALCILLAHTNGRYHFQFAGDGPERERLENFFIQSAFDNISADFLGLVPFCEMSSLWRGTDVAILFSEFEGTSISMLEAMAQGACPVVTNVSGVKDVVTDGVNGFVCDIGDMKKMALVLQRLYESPQVLGSTSEQAWLSIASQGSFESYDLEFIKLAKACIESAPPSWPLDRAVFPASEENAVPSTEDYTLQEIVKSLSKRLLMRVSLLPSH